MMHDQDRHSGGTFSVSYPDRRAAAAISRTDRESLHIDARALESLRVRRVKLRLKLK